MRLWPLLFFALAGSVLAGEGPAEPTYPLWDGQESVARYAERVGLPAAMTLDLGGGVKMELLLIPAGQFVMGTPEPTPVDEDGFNRQIMIGQVVLAASAAALLIMLATVALRALRQKRRPQLSLGRLTLVTAAAGSCVLSGLHWRQSARGLEAARAEYEAALGRFRSARSNEIPAHSVTLTQPFYMGKFVVTQAQYQRVSGSNPSHFKGQDNPVELVSWEDAQAFCKRLSEQTKQTVRLPTEAEWEYACRARTKSTYYSGYTEADLARVAWYSANSKKTTHPVGQKEPNIFGLYDMHGNVWQWCQDWYGEDYYGKSEAENPQGPAQGASHVLRCGSWGNDPIRCRSANRDWRIPDIRNFLIGFRVAVSVAPRTR